LGKKDPRGGFETIRFEKKSAIAHIRLCRPDVLNVYNTQMRDDLYEILGAINKDPDVKTVIVSGSGKKAFCAGADLSEFLTAPSPDIARQVRWRRDVWGRFLSLPQPLIAALHGYVLGSGLEIALCCDIRICSQDTRFGVPEVGLGIIPAAGGSQTLPRIIGTARAIEMLYTRGFITSTEAYRYKLVNQVVAWDDLQTAAFELAQKISGFHPEAIQLAKRTVLRGLDLSLAAGLELEKRSSTALGRQCVKN